MAFANIGASGALVAAANILPAGAYALQPNGTASATGPYWRKSAAGVAGRQSGSDRSSRLNQIAIIAAGGDLLVDFVATPAAIANADTGAFVTAAAAANQHGLPANFGPGRGNWIADDVARVTVEVWSGEQGGDGRVSVSALSIVLAVATGNLTITIHNSALAAGANNLPTGTQINLRYFED